jgi:hypothetical protein
MARPMRIDFTGAVYHLMARGNERKAVFRDDEDRRIWLKTRRPPFFYGAYLARVCSKV